jgi:hypothetical protein
LFLASRGQALAEEVSEEDLFQVFYDLALIKITNDKCNAGDPEKHEDISMRLVRAIGDFNMVMDVAKDVNGHERMAMFDNTINHMIAEFADVIVSETLELHDGTDLCEVYKNVLQKAEFYQSEDTRGFMTHLIKFVSGSRAAIKDFFDPRIKWD